MKLALSSLRSKVARRVLAVFLLCALLPFSGLVLVAYYQVAGFFETRNQNQLRDLAKLFGLDVHEKLTLLTASLQILASTVKATGKLPEYESLDYMTGGHKDRWSGLFFFEASDGPRRLTRAQLDLPDFTAAGKKQLAAGRAVITVLPASQDLPARIFLSVLVDPAKSRSDILTAEVDNSYVWGFKDSRLLPSHIEPCVVDVTGVTLMCSAAHFHSLPQELKKNFDESGIGSFDWTANGQNYLVSYWTVPMKFEFQLPGWVIVLRTSKEGAFASVKDLQTFFILSIVVSVGLSVLLAIFQIRKRLVPVEKLQEGTQRIAQNDFGFKVQIRSNDEFEELANSVNTMAEQLGRQFHTLQTKAEIDRAVLSLLNTEQIVQTILTRFSAVFPCDCAGVTLFAPDPGEPDQLYFLTRDPAGAEGGRQSPPQPPLSPPRDGDFRNGNHGHRSSRAVTGRERDPIARLAAQAAAPLTLSASDAAVAQSEFAENLGAHSVMAAPLVVRGEKLGVLTFYSREPDRFGAQELDFLRGLTDQAAIAVYNSQLFERTQRQAVELKKANQAKDEFLGVMSHELRTPLNVTLGYLRMLQEGILGEVSEEQGRAIGTALKNAGELHAMIESIMQVTKLEAGAVVVDKGPIDPVDFLDEIKSRYGYPLGKDITLSWQYPAELPTIVTDRAKLTTILQNLLGNAIKFTDRGAVSLSARFVAELGSIEFTVADTGIGIAKESQAVIFEMFRQLDSSNTREHEGVGLGLYIVRKLADLIGAKISLESDAGQGATFTVTLPVGNGGATL
ncbi:MAG: GAF domain-containing protein [Deltaproteobacteria bacterium]|nr:GAF domain-containing protein [Deltaproteobacteria bacterium]